MDTDSEIYRLIRDDLMRYATTLVGASHAEDVLSTVVVKTLRRRKLSSLRNARAYLFRAVLNEARSRSRQMRRRVGVEFREASLTDDHPDAEIAAAIRRLPLQQRAAIYLVYWEDLTIADAATAMGTRPGTVKRYLHLARNSLREALQWTMATNEN